MTYTDLLGIKYRPHGRNKKEGFDCYGLVIEVLKRNGIKFPDLYYESIKDTERLCRALKNKVIKPLEKPEVNCIIEITNCGEPSHMAVYIGDGYMIHTSIATNVVIEPVKHYEHRIKGYWKVNS